MTTQVTFRIEDDLKKRAVQKAKAEWVSLKTIYLYLTQAWLDWKLELWMVWPSDDLVLSKEEQKALAQARKDLKSGEYVDAWEVMRNLLN